LLSYVVAFAVYLRLRRYFGDPVAIPLRWAAVAAAVAGAALGSKLLFWLEDPRLTLQNLHNPAYLIGGKTIVGALIGGLITVELMKRYIGLRTSTGDLYAIPLAVGIAIGRVGCFLTGLSDNTYGISTNLPCGIDFGDGIRRHPTQLYEIAFLVTLIPALYKVLKRIVIQSEVTAQSKDLTVGTLDADTASSPSAKAALGTHNSVLGTRFLPGDAFKLFMISYMSFRLLAEFIKPYPRLCLGLGGIQWACVLALLYYSRDILRWLSPQSTPRPI
jgi:prolipoprotein diacylglyceryltransferase